jgi:hypothetical protein
MRTLFATAAAAIAALAAALPAAAAGTVIYQDDGYSQWNIVTHSGPLALPGAGVYHVQVTSDYNSLFTLDTLWEGHSHIIADGYGILQGSNNPMPRHRETTGFAASFTFEVPQTLRENYRLSGPQFDYLVPVGTPIHDETEFEDPTMFLRAEHRSENLFHYNVTITRFEAVPEPATWAMMIMGFGLIGALRRRSAVAERVAA